MDKNMDWIYRAVPMDPDLERTLEAVEKAMGFKLFVWQKTYIERGCFRQYGATTAEILRDLLDASKPPLDYTKPTANHMEQFYRKETREIKAKLDAAGIPTRAVFFSTQEKQTYYSAAGTRQREKNTIPGFTPEYGKKIWE